MPNAASVKSADRVLDLLELLSRRGDTLSHSDIAFELGIPKSSLTHLLRNLTARGYLTFLSGSNTYGFGPAFFALLQRGQEGVDIVQFARPILEKLTAATRESCSLNLNRGDYVERACGVDSPQELTTRMTVGYRFPLYSTSGGKVVLAALPLKDRERYLGRVRLERRTEVTIQSVAELRRQLTEVAKTGVAFSRGEQVAGCTSVATVVRRPSDGYPIGALVVVAPSVRFDDALEKCCIKALKAAASALERELKANLNLHKLPRVGPENGRINRQKENMPNLPANPLRSLSPGGAEESEIDIRGIARGSKR